MPGLSVEGLTVRGNGPYTAHILAGECVGLLGPSGAGKTVLLRAIADLDPHTGQVRLDDQPCDTIPAPQWRQWVGLLPADSRWWHEKVGDHFPDATATDPATLGLPHDVMGWQVTHLSAGERQRLALLRLLARAPRCLLLDEPTANLDPENARLVEKAISRYREIHKAPVIWVAHDRKQLERTSERILTLSPGGLEPIA